MDRIKQFEGELDSSLKRLMSKGIWPRSPFWATAKINEVFRLAKKLQLNFTFDEDDIHFNNAKRLRKIFIFRHNTFLLFLNYFYLLGKDIFKRTHTLDGLKIWVRGIRSNDKMSDILRNYEVLDIYEPETTKLVKELVKEGDVCVDIGASIGYFSLQFSRLVGKNGKVIAIEPTDFQQPYLRKNIKINGFKDIVKQFAVGAWDKDEVVRMPRNAPDHVQTELRCRPIDDILEELGIMEVDFIKIDVDGPEPKVLKGLEQTIKRSPNLKMVFEYYPKYIRDAGLEPQDALDFLNKYFTYTVIPGDYEGGCWNYLCTRKI